MGRVQHLLRPLTAAEVDCSGNDRRVV